MSYLESIILGVVQGLGEFLPISSSAHLVIVPWALRFKDPGLTFDVALHFGTLFAILFYFWREWIDILTGACRYTWKTCTSSPSPLMGEGGGEGDSERTRLFFFLVLATIPGAMAGYFLDDLAETTLRHPLLIAVNMSALGFVLLLADRFHIGKKTVTGVKFLDSVLIGCAQSLALIPGVSRAGITMTAGLLTGFTREATARFSFLMAAPITLGACVFKAKDFFSEPVTGPVLAGILVSTLFGFLSIKYLLRYLQTHTFRIFVYYRFAFSAAVFLLYFYSDF